MITPAVKDALRERGITLGWAIQNSNQQNKNSATPAAKSAPLTNSKQTRTLVLGQVAQRFEVPGLVRQLTEQGLSVQELARSGLDSVTAELATAAARDGALTLLLTDQPWAAVIAANRHAGVRAAWVRDRRETTAALLAVKTNLLIIDVTGQTRFGIWNTIVPFVKPTT